MHYGRLIIAGDDELRPRCGGGLYRRQKVMAFDLTRRFPRSQLDNDNSLASFSIFAAFIGKPMIRLHPR